MPKFALKPDQMADIATFLHWFRVNGYDASRQKPPSIVVGNATAGEAYFNEACASCHSASGDLRASPRDRRRAHAAAVVADARQRPGAARRAGQCARRRRSRPEPGKVGDR